jgi:ferredoxin
MFVRLDFPGTGFPPLELPVHAPLSMHLTPANSPILFGCREGVCGTCLIEVVAHGPQLPAPSPHEAEALAVYAPERPHARLACQLDLTADITIRKL